VSNTRALECTLDPREGHLGASNEMGPTTTALSYGAAIHCGYISYQSWRRRQPAGIHAQVDWREERG
jgi:hypothetical protein